MRPIVLVLACALCAPAFAGDVYKWKDAQGNVHYGDKPKAGGDEVEIRGTGGKGPALHDPAEVAATSAREAECKRKKDKLAMYQQAPSISETDNLGKTREYSEEERQLFLKRYEKETSEACAPPAQ